METSSKKDWRIGITWDVLVMGVYTLGSLFEIISDPGSTNVISLLLLAGVSYFTYSTYSVQRNNLIGQRVKSALTLGIIVLAAFLFFAVANFMLMTSGELAGDISYLNILLISALFKSVFTLRKLTNVAEQNK